MRQTIGTLKKSKLLKELSAAFRNMRLQLKTPEKIFTEYYRNNYWRDPNSRSGPGSNLEQTAALREALPQLFSKYSIDSILDVPCGDFFWFSKIALSENITYTGADIVAEIVKQNTRKYANARTRFIRLDLTKDLLPKSDIIILRDCLVHLSFKDITAVIKTVKSSGSKYLLTTHYLNREANHDIATGLWRTLNLQRKPFNFPDPIEFVIEDCTEGNGAFSDKSMALWKISEL
jgi:SAM-dependent methyltransferase